MKKCEHFKDLILTDYIDGELHKNSAADMEKHLLECSDCRTFAKEAKGNAAVFQRALHQPVPAELWTAVMQGIEAKEHAESPLEEFLDRLKGLIVFSRAVPVFASFVLMFLVGSVTLSNMQVQHAQAQDQGEYLVSLLSPTSAASSTESNDLGTPIEHYFL